MPLIKPKSHKYSKFSAMVLRWKSRGETKQGALEKAKHKIAHTGQRWTKELTNLFNKCWNTPVPEIAPKAPTKNAVPKLGSIVDHTKDAKAIKRIAKRAMQVKIEQKVRNEPYAGKVKRIRFDVVRTELPLTKPVLTFTKLKKYVDEGKIVREMVVYVRHSDAKDDNELLQGVITSWQLTTGRIGVKTAFGIGWYKLVYKDQSGRELIYSM